MSELHRIFRPIDEGKPFGQRELPCLPEFILTDPDKNTITFTLQEGPIGNTESKPLTMPQTYGVNGCQVDHMIWAVATILRSFNSRFPCRENSIAITHLDEAMLWLEKRTKDRTERKVEGTDQK